VQTDNKAIANVFSETAELMEVQGDDSFRIRSYRRAAEALEGLQEQVSAIYEDEKALLAIPGIGKSMATNIREICTTGKLTMHQDLLKKYGSSILDLLKLQGLGPKTIALIWDSFHVSDIDGLEKLAREGKLRELPRQSEKSEQKILRAIESYRQVTGRFQIVTADEVAQQMTELLKDMQGVDKVTPAGSLRRGRETVGDLDLLVTGKVGSNEALRAKAIDRILTFPGIKDVLAKGDNKVSFKLLSGLQVDVRLLPPDSFGAALQYFTGSKSHSVSLRQRALRMGYTLNEYGLAALKDEKRVAGKTEEEIYKKLGLAWIPPELRENLGEIEAAEKNELPELITQADLKGDVHMHTVATDGKCTIEEMAEAARERGYEYMAITDHSKNLAFANGLDDKRAVEHIKKIRKAAKNIEGITVFAGIEVDILADGELDLSDSVLEQMDVVVASIHSHFAQERQQTTDRLLRAVANSNVSIIGHPTGRLLLRREGYAFDYETVFIAAAKAGVAMEHNSYPDRLDLSELHLRLAKSKGVKFVVNTDSHHTSHLQNMKFGVLQLRRAWLTRDDVLNTQPVAKFAKLMRRGRPELSEA
jgi:DNA polymerase (family 10)